MAALACRVQTRFQRRSSAQSARTACLPRPREQAASRANSLHFSKCLAPCMPGGDDVYHERAARTSPVPSMLGGGQLRCAGPPSIAACPVRAGRRRKTAESEGFAAPAPSAGRRRGLCRVRQGVLVLSTPGNCAVSGKIEAGAGSIPLAPGGHSARTGGCRWCTLRPSHAGRPRLRLCCRLVATPS